MKLICHETTIFDEVISLFHSPDLSLYTEQPLTVHLEVQSILFYPVLSYPIPSHRVLPQPLLACIVLISHALSYHNVACLILVLSYPNFPYHILLYLLPYCPSSTEDKKA